MAPQTPLTLEGLAGILQRHIEHTAARFEDVERQIQSLARDVQTLVGQGEALFGLVRDQGLRVMALAEQQAEQQAQIRQILHRLEQHDARFEEHERRFQEMLRRLDQNDARLEQHDIYIRRMLDALERRGGDGGSRPT